MATVLRNDAPYVTDLANAVNNLKAQIGAGSAFHLDVSEVTVTAPNGAGTLAGAIALANNIIAVLKFHFADTLTHKAADSTSLPSPLDPVNATLANAESCANSLHTAWGTHIASTAVHYNADAVNTDGSSSASDQATTDTRLNALKAAINAHFGSGGAPSGVAPSIRAVSA